MKILIDNGCQDLKNMGDVAMLQVAVVRLKHLWPDAVIQIITLDPDRLIKYCPDAYAVSAYGRNRWLEYQENILWRFHPFVPKFISMRIANYDWPLISQALIWMRMKFRGLDYAHVKSFLGSTLESDLVIVSGGGDLTDLFEDFAVTLLDVLRVAIQYGKTTAMVGQGIGPILDSNSRFAVIGKEVLPKVNVICSREKIKGPAILESFNVEGSRVFITGDDAIEMAYNAHVQELGRGIGVNLRVASYSGLEADLVDMVGLTLQEAAKKYQVPLIPVPISFNELESDPKTICKLLAKYDSTSDGGQNMDTPIKIIQQVARCRVVVTGSYHAAVFALSQGIPVVCLAKTSYYKDKFLGLSDQFNVDGGCEVIILNDGPIGEQLLKSIDKAWVSAEDIRSSLLNAARRQIETGRNAYQKIYDAIKEVSI